MTKMYHFCGRNTTFRFGRVGLADSVWPFGLSRFGLSRFGLGRFGLSRFGLTRFGLGRFNLGRFGLAESAWAISVWPIRSSHFGLARFCHGIFRSGRFGLGNVGHDISVHKQSPAIVNGFSAQTRKIAFSNFQKMRFFQPIFSSPTTMVSDIFLHWWLVIVLASSRSQKMLPKIKT